jgi:P4 family phage/plasmid primase-like protien
MGYLKTAIAGGFPADLIISTMPAGGKSLGGCLPKAPAFFNENQNGWYCPQTWQRGISHQEREYNDSQGANAGLICGVVSQGQQFLLFDFDIQLFEESEAEQKALAVYSIVMDCFSRAMQGRKFWVRKTHAYRGMVAVRIDPNEEAGSISQVFMNYKDSKTPRVKLELLAKGQQGVVCGVHDAGPIRWHPYEYNNQTYACVNVGESSVPTFATRGVVDTILDQTIFHLNYYKFTESWQKRGGVHSRSYGFKDTPQTLAPPGGVQRLIEVLNNAYNGPDVGRAVYVHMAKAVSGCRKALLAQGRLTIEEDTQLRDAWANWAVRYAGSKSTYQYEIEKWDEDWKHTETTHTGWHYLLDVIRIHLGDTDIVNREAAEEFSLVPLPAGSDGENYRIPDGTNLKVYARDMAGMNNYDTVRLPRPRDTVDVKTSELQIADAVQDALQGNLLWVAEEKRWLLWERSHWSPHKAALIVQQMIADQHAYYVRKHGLNWNETTQAKLLSQARFEAIDKILRTRFAISTTELDQGKYLLQTPIGCIDLRTGGLYDRALQRELHDTRVTTLSPQGGETPIFDGLMYNLCNGKHETREWFLSFLGYALTGQPREHVFTFLWGPGGNGKSTLLNILAHILGSYACSAERDIVLSAGRDKHLTFLYDLKGKRLAFISEMPPNEKWNEARLKSLTGLDKQRANRMRMDSIEFKPEAAFLMAGQYMPVFEKVDQSVARRVRIIGTHIMPESDDKLLEDRIIEQEGPAILDLLINYARKVIANDMCLPDVPSAMKREITKYLDDQDSFFGWFRDECALVRTKENAEVSIEELQNRYDNYMRRKRERMGMDADMMFNNDMSDSNFLDGLRRFGAIVEDEAGNRLRKKVGLKYTYMARGIRLKMVSVESAPTTTMMDVVAEMGL